MRSVIERDLTNQVIPEVLFFLHEACMALQRINSESDTTY